MNKIKIEKVEIVRDVVERIVELLSFSVFLALVIVGVYAFIDINAVNNSAKLDKILVDISADFDKDVDRSIKELKAINPEIEAWIRIDNTSIDFPVLQSKEDNAKYLTRNYRAEYAVAGSIFADYRNDLLKDKFSVIYGHRMVDDLMFTDILKYSDKDFFNTHEKGSYYLEDGAYDLQVLAYAKLSTKKTKIYRVDTNKNLDYNQIKKLLDIDIVHKRDVKDIGKDSRLLLLSTCDNDSSIHRNVLLVKITKRKG